MELFSAKTIKVVGFLVIPTICWLAMGYAARKPIRLAAAEVEHTAHRLTLGARLSPPGSSTRI